MLFSFSWYWIIFLNFVFLFLLHMISSYAATLLPRRFFNPSSWICRERKWEKKGRIYQKFFKVKSWKDRLPDGAALFKRGFAKKHLLSRDAEYISSFIIETCRGELAHWSVIILSPLSFVYTWWWGGVIIVLYALSASLPCIIVQRYNRIRLRMMMDKHFICSSEDVSMS